MSRPVADNELIGLYRETFDAVRSYRGLRCRNCGKPMTPGATRIADGIEVWHPVCVREGKSSCSDGSTTRSGQPRRK